MHTKLSIISSYKNSSFLLPDFRRIREMIFGSEILRPIDWVGVIKSLFDFSKSCPLRYHIFIQAISRWNEVFIRISDNDHQFFQDSYCSKIWKHFHLLFFIFFWIGIYSLFRSINKIHDDKNVKNKFIHFMQMLTSKQCLHLSKSTFTNENIYDQKTNKNYP